MKVAILDRLCCPRCKGSLELRLLPDDGSYSGIHATEPNAELPSPNIERLVNEGLLLCEPCRTYYPISAGVPVMLLFRTPFHDRFARTHAKILGDFSEYHTPDGSPEPGERSVQETFTAEWDTVQDSHLSFAYSPEDLKRLHREVWLQWAAKPEEVSWAILNVGCGLGRESAALQDVFPKAEVFGVDLNFALLQSGKVYDQRPGFHLVIASLFHLPFRAASFDLVYSQGVIHHTFSTDRAFHSIANFVQRDGHLFVWVYGLDDHVAAPGMAGLVARFKFHFEGIARPLLSRSPTPVRNMLFHVLTLLCHPMYLAKEKHRATWRLENTNHALRDRLSPRYAHRHSYNDVIRWFEELDFTIVDVQSPAAYARLFGRRLWGVGMTGRKN